MAAATGSGCRKNESEALPEAVAMVEGVPITADELRREWERRPLGGQSSSESSIRDAVLAEMIRHRALLHRARADGLDRDPETLRRMERVIVARYLEAHRPDPETLSSPSDEEIRAGYEARRSEFATPERFRIAMIALRGSPKASPEKVLELRQRAERLRIELVDATSHPDAFAHLARKHSEDRTTRYQGGDLGWIEPGSKDHPWPREVVSAMTRLESDGELSDVIETPSGCYLLKRLGHQPAGTRPLAEVREEIAHRLLQDRKKALAAGFEQRLLAGLQIEIRTDLVSRVPAPEARLARSDSQPPSLPRR